MIFVGILEVYQIDPRKMPLGKLFEEAFLDRHGYNTEEPESASKEMCKFNLLVEIEKKQQGIVIKDWTRSIGVNSVIKAEHDAEEAGLTGVILVGNRFSLQAKGMANRTGIRLVSRGELVVNYHQNPAIF